MNVLGLGLLLASAAASSLTVSEATQVHTAVSVDFRDPGTAQFRNVERRNTDDGLPAYCGEVNGKNAYGGYVGFVGFYYNPSIGRVWMASGDGADPRIVQMMCD